MNGDAARVLDDGGAGAEDAGEFVSARVGRERVSLGGKEEQDGGELDEPAAADYGIDKARQEREQAEKKYVHRRELILIGRQSQC